MNNDEDETPILYLNLLKVETNEEAKVMLESNFKMIPLDLLQTAGQGTEWRKEYSQPFQKLKRFRWRTVFKILTNSFTSLLEPRA